MEIESKIQKWGNGLALRVSGVMRDMPDFQEGTKVTVEVTEEGLLIKKMKPNKHKSLPFSEAELLEGLNSDTIHSELVATVTNKEMGDE